MIYYIQYNTLTVVECIIRLHSIYYTMLYYTRLYYIILYYTPPGCTVLSYTILHYTTLYSSLLFSSLLHPLPLSCLTCYAISYTLFHLYSSVRPPPPFPPFISTLLYSPASPPLYYSRPGQAVLCHHRPSCTLISAIILYDTFCTYDTRLAMS